MSIISVILFLHLLECERMVSVQGALSVDQAIHCVQHHQALVAEVGSSYEEYRMWRHIYEPIILEELQKLVK